MTTKTKTKAAKMPAKRAKAGTSKESAEFRRRQFVEAFLSNEGNATQAAIDAGFSPKTAHRAGNRMVNDVRVLSEIDRRRTELAAKTELNTERLVREVGRLVFSDLRRLCHPDGRMKALHELDDDTAAAVASVKVNADGSIEYKLWDKNSAQERASKIVGVFEKDNKQKVEPVTVITRRIIE